MSVPAHGSFGHWFRCGSLTKCPNYRTTSHLMIAKFANHLPLYRQQSISGRTGLPIASSTLTHWIGILACSYSRWSTRSATLCLGSKSSTPMNHLYRCSRRARRKPTAPMSKSTSPASSHTCQLWFTTLVPSGPETRSQLPQTRKASWFAMTLGYKSSFKFGVAEISYIAHARSKLFELHTTNRSTLAEQALRYIQLESEAQPGSGFTAPNTTRKTPSR